MQPRPPGRLVTTTGTGQYATRRAGLATASTRSGSSLKTWTRRCAPTSSSPSPGSTRTVSSSSRKTPSRTCKCGLLCTDGCVSYSLISFCHASSCVVLLSSNKSGLHLFPQDSFQDVQMWVVTKCGLLCTDGCVGYNLISFCHVSSCVVLLSSNKSGLHLIPQDSYQDVQMWVVMY